MESSSSKLPQEINKNSHMNIFCSNDNSILSIENDYFNSNCFHKVCSECLNESKCEKCNNGFTRLLTMNKSNDYYKNLSLINEFRSNNFEYCFFHEKKKVKAIWKNCQNNNSLNTFVCFDCYENKKEGQKIILIDKDFDIISHKNILEKEKKNSLKNLKLFSDAIENSTSSNKENINKIKKYYEKLKNHYRTEFLNKQNKIDREKNNKLSSIENKIEDIESIKKWIEKYGENLAPFISSINSICNFEVKDQDKISEYKKTIDSFKKEYQNEIGSHKFKFEEDNIEKKILIINQTNDVESNVGLMKSCFEITSFTKTLNKV